MADRLQAQRQQLTVRMQLPSPMHPTDTVVKIPFSFQAVPGFFLSVSHIHRLLLPFHIEASLFRERTGNLKV